MDLIKIREVLIKKIITNQKLNGIRGLTVVAETKPFKDLDKFDSMTALEVLVEVELELEELYGIDVDLDISVFKEFERTVEGKPSRDIADITIDEISINISKRKG